MSDPVTGNAPADRTTEFHAVEGDVEEFSGGTLLVQAYAAIWLIVFGLIAMLWNQQRRVHARLDALDKSLDKLAAKAK